MGFITPKGWLWYRLKRYARGKCSKEEPSCEPAGRAGPSLTRFFVLGTSIMAGTLDAQYRSSKQLNKLSPTLQVGS